MIILEEVGDQFRDNTIPSKRRPWPSRDADTAMAQGLYVELLYPWRLTARSGRIGQKNIRLSNESDRIIG